MAKLTTKQRNALPSSEFAIPSERKYPINDASHKKNAKARASEMKNKGVISASTKSKIDSKANRGESVEVERASLLFYNSTNHRIPDFFSNNNLLSAW